MIFIENDKLILEFVRICKGSGIGKNDFERERKMENLRYLILRLTIKL